MADVALDVLHDGVATHEPLGVVAGVGKARQLALPVGGDEAKRVPPFGAPGVGDLVLLQHDVVKAPALQAIAHRQPRLATADHNYAVVHGHR